MSRNKTARFAEMQNFKNVFQPPIDKEECFPLKGKWNESVFKNSYPLILELGCGKGEYTIGLGKAFTQYNYIGVDIKGARMYVGAKKAINENMNNVAFLRTRIELIENFFAPDEVDEIWITFPDPQPKMKWAKKRLTSSHFINKYRNITRQNAVFHLKTDSVFLYHYTLALLQKNEVNILCHTDNVYETTFLDSIYNIKTHYENLFTAQGYKITYIKWENPLKETIELSHEEYKKIEERYL
ncbi:MAG TPA: tRNA (guanosine(46)-N7)-methyltransferase TrmB [Bacteroidales bacterium]|mgnify:FL=1|jgi:tRNA (guanine-N7-)-methyltransferase|nr:tRNA (guanosine(46)-N7)-methyltransferase TrmB [Bacteroidales bacterium]HNV96268.1 tRNA (guanosine(46)-N7)-methyltransferase TrmB [Bacteroidales bacterium]